MTFGLMRSCTRPYLGYGIGIIFQVVQWAVQGVVKEMTRYDHVERVQYCQVCSGIKGCQRLDHTIN
ncbi:hypothetical protein F383_14308 [Gossypium arboreum]|uniref:Uncharacterized protein n=1 Tax=Gossypium arboreum TaxID=29729 RepID=A0A0B0MFA4_GOSAR|nr:hypothetical protein F383_14308 [Gossypium arboreum]